MIAFFFLIIVAAGVGVAYLALKSRQPSSIESGISSFRREMDALAPDRQRRVETDSGVGPMRRDEVEDPEAP